jgi:hypothetical protein
MNIELSDTLGCNPSECAASQSHFNSGLDIRNLCLESQIRYFVGWTNILQIRKLRGTCLFLKLLRTTPPKYCLNYSSAPYS